MSNFATTATPEQIRELGGSPVPTTVLDQSNHSIHWKQCITCRNVKDPRKFQRNSAFKDGYAPQCDDCRAVPRLSTEEHIDRLWELNYYAKGTQAQRWDHMGDYANEAARLSGKWKHSNSLIFELRKLIPAGRLFITEGGLENHLAFYRICEQAREEWGNRSFKYLWGLKIGWMPEYSTYKFTDRDIPVKESRRGWRTHVLRFITEGLLDEERANKFFGEPRGAASTVYRRTLYGWRNRARHNKSTVAIGL